MSTRELSAYDGQECISKTKVGKDAKVIAFDPTNPITSTRSMCTSLAVQHADADDENWRACPHARAGHRS
jgi:hypothetical protein